MIQKGDRVIRVQKPHPMYTKSVSIGTLGTVENILGNGLAVRWDTGPITGCNLDCVELITVSNNAQAKRLLDKEW